MPKVADAGPTRKPVATPVGSGAAVQAQWNEQLHPRGQHGRFVVSKGAGYDGNPDESTKQLQERLKQLGYNIPVDGKFGVATEAAVKSFQNQYGLETNGGVDAATLALLRDPAGSENGPSQTYQQAAAQKNAASAAKKTSRKAASAARKAARQKAKAAAKQRQLKRQQAAQPGGHGSRGGSHASRLRGPGSSHSSRASGSSVGGPGNMGTGDLHLGIGMGHAQDPAVENLQTALDNLGYDLKSDGRFGQQTESAVRKLQRRYGLPANGIVDKRTKRLILQLQARTRAQNASMGPDSIRTITEGQEVEEQVVAFGWGDQPSRSIMDARPEGGPEYDRPIYSSATGAKVEPFKPQDEQHPSPEESPGELDNDGDRPPSVPPNYRETGLSEATDGNTPMCAHCTRFDGSATCLGWTARVNRTGVCDAFDNLAARIGAIREAAEQRQVAQDGDGFTRALAREQRLRQRLEEIRVSSVPRPWDATKHPRGRGGEFSQVLKQIQAMRSGERLRYGSHTVTKHSGTRFRVDSPGGVSHHDAPSGVASLVASAFGESGVPRPRSLRRIKAPGALDAVINFGGVPTPKGEVIRQLQAEGHPQVYIDRYLQGADRAAALREEAMPYELDTKLLETVDLRERSSGIEFIRARAREGVLRQELEERDFSGGKRKELAKKGVAMQDGSFPIQTTKDLENAKQAIGRAPEGKREAVKAHIRKRAKALGVQEADSRDDDAHEAVKLSEAAVADLGSVSLQEALGQLDWLDFVLVQEAKDSLAKASTPEPFSSSRTSNWVARGGGLPAYIQHIAHDLMEKRGKSESNAIQMAIGICKRWARGGGKVDANTRVAAAKAVSEWEALKGKNAAKGAAKAAAGK